MWLPGGSFAPRGVPGPCARCRRETAPGVWGESHASSCPEGSRAASQPAQRGEMERAPGAGPSGLGPQEGHCQQNAAALGESVNATSTLTGMQGREARKKLDVSSSCVRVMQTQVQPPHVPSHKHLWHGVRGTLSSGGRPTVRGARLPEHRKGEALRGPGDLGLKPHPGQSPFRLWNCAPTQQVTPRSQLCFHTDPSHAHIRHVTATEVMHVTNWGPPLPHAYIRSVYTHSPTTQTSTLAITSWVGRKPQHPSARGKNTPNKSGLVSFCQ